MTTHLQEIEKTQNKFTYSSTIYYNNFLSRQIKIFSWSFNIKLSKINGVNRQKVRRISVQLSSVTQSCPTLCNPMNCSTPGLPVHHQLSEFTQTHVHRVRDAIQPSHPLSFPSPPAPDPSQHQSLFQ